MQVSAISCANYKAFRERVELELRPLTVILGKNNAGKSALARLIPLLLRALGPRVGQAPLDLSVGDLAYGVTFRDLIHGRSPHGSVELGLVLSDGPERLHLESRIQNVSVPGAGADYSVIASWHLRSPFELQLTWRPSRAMPPEYEGSHRPRFRGLWPVVTRPDEPWAPLSAWASRLEAMESAISYLGPLRRPVPEVCVAGQRSRDVGLHGENAPSLLESDERLCKLVGAWFAEHLEGWELMLDHAGSAFSCVLRRGSIAVNLAHTGEGMSQVLPVIVQQCLARIDADGPRLLVSEHPELHLHPAAHAPLADLVIGGVKDVPGYQAIVETHSENFLLRLRRRVAGKDIDAEKVALYWVDELADGTSTVRRLSLEPNGDIPDWPEGVFSESYHEVLAMRRAARGQASGA